MLIVEGAHVPAILLVEVPGSAGAAVPWQKSGIAVKVGTIGVFTVTLSEAVVAHRPAVGVNV